MGHIWKELRYVQKVGTKGQWQAIEPERLVSSPRAAELLGIKPQTLRKWRMLGKGPATSPMGKRQGYRMADLAKFFEESSTMPPEFRYSWRYTISTMRRNP